MTAPLDVIAALDAEVAALRRALAKCYVLAGSDPDGCDPDTDEGAEHLYRYAVDAVRELRDAHDEVLWEAPNERAAVVEWLRQHGGADGDRLAAAIEAGEHAGGEG